MNYNHLMNEGKKLESKKLYRRAAAQYNKAALFSVPPSNGCAFSRQETAARKSATHCLIKAKIKIPGGML